MKSRMQNPAVVLPEAMSALQALGSAIRAGGVPQETLGLVELRASQINGCSMCADMHPRIMRKAGESDERLLAVAAWRDTPYFLDPERAALALAEAVTRIADRSDAVPQDIWDEASRHFDEKQLSALLLSIAQINVWNRLNVATKQMVGDGPKWG